MTYLLSRLYYGIVLRLPDFIDAQNMTIHVNKQLGLKVWRQHFSSQIIQSTLTCRKQTFTNIWSGKYEFGAQVPSRQIIFTSDSF